MKWWMIQRQPLLSYNNFNVSKFIYDFIYQFIIFIRNKFQKYYFKKMFLSVARCSFQLRCSGSRYRDLRHTSPLGVFERYWHFKIDPKLTHFFQKKILQPLAVLILSLHSKFHQRHFILFIIVQWN